MCLRGPTRVPVCLRGPNRVHDGSSIALQMHSEAADALPKLKQQLDGQNQQVVRLEETNKVLAEQNNQVSRVPPCPVTAE